MGGVGAMKVVGIVPSPSSVSIVLIDNGSGKPEAKYKDEWDVGEDRLAGYGMIRSRLIEKLSQWMPDAVVITAFEPFSLRAGRANSSWFQTAEVRGMLSEAARSVVPDTEQVQKAAITRTIGKSKAEKYRTDDGFWNAQFGPGFPKKYRDAALLVFTRIPRT